MADASTAPPAPAGERRTQHNQDGSTRVELLHMPDDVPVRWATVRPIRIRDLREIANMAREETPTSGLDELADLCRRFTDLSQEAIEALDSDDLSAVLEVIRERLGKLPGGG